MGLPAIQVVMIIVRQMSKPIANMIMDYGKEHPGFRNKLLIPIGRKLAHLTTRVRMKNLGLGAPTSIAPVTEAAALEQASEFLQQVTVFFYTCGAAYGYYIYTKATAKESISPEQFEEFKEEMRRNYRIMDDKIEQIVQQKGIRLKPYIPPPPQVKETSESNQDDSWFSSISFEMPFLATVKKLMPIKRTSEESTLENVSAKSES